MKPCQQQVPEGPSVTITFSTVVVSPRACGRLILLIFCSCVVDVKRCSGRKSGLLQTVRHCRRWQTVSPLQTVSPSAARLRTEAFGDEIVDAVVVYT